MTTQVTYPSADFPASPTLTMDCPQGWVPLPGVGLPLAIAMQVPEGEFRPNVIAVLSRFRAEQAIDSAIDEVIASMTRLEGYTEIGREERQVSGFPGFRIEGAFTNSTGGTLAQAVRLALVPNGPVQDLVQITGTCSGTQSQTIWQEIRTIQDSVRIEP